ncbi:hypothetical protein D7Z26_15025 [Cohnella endophytica]|uniref:LysM domain-containing protein n=1 Tax=Cohnella endophytica TaxID=2419778 RepID=A0A494XVR4_9BACL|nr:hypothetical protein [Cohnella endophytica]RKP53046.1 hypothetical protein D7Z26_15025 [Cohnella endophytica]
MKNTVRTLGITAALAVMIPLSAYAANSSGSSSTTVTEKKSEAAWSFNGGATEKRGDFERGGKFVGQEVLDLLKLDQAGLDEKIKAGSTLAQIAEQQGVTREQLKSAMTAAYNKQLEERKQEYADNLDKMIDSKPTDNQKWGRGGSFGAPTDFTAAGTLLGLSADEVKTQLKAGKSLADLAKEKGVEAQKLIDAQAAAITSSINQAVKDGKLTQAQADNQLKNVADIAAKIVNGKGFGEGRHPGGAGKGRGEDKPTIEADTSSSSAS